MNTAPLIVRCGAFGDMVLLTPLIRLLAARYGRRVDLLSAGAWTPPLLGAMPELGHIRILTSRNAPYALWPNQWSTVRWLRQRGDGPVYLCDVGVKIRALLTRAGLAEDAIVDGLARRPGDVGEIPWPDRWLDVGQRNPPSYRAPHAVENAESLRFPRLPVDDRERAAITQWRRQSGITGPLIAFQPGNKRTHKRGQLGTFQQNKFWPPQRWAHVARAILADHPEARIVLCGSPVEHAVLEAIRQTCNDARVLNLARELPVPRLIALLDAAHSMISVDTGPAHAAAALGCPLVALFGAAPIALWQPLGPAAVRVLGGERGTDSRVDDIAAETVIAAWRSLPPR